MPRTRAKTRSRARARAVKRVSATPAAKKKPIEQYDHKGKDRVNNPPVGLVTPETDVETQKKTYAYDPYLDPQLVWAGKAEHTSFEVPTVSLHVHERIDPRSIIEAVRKHDEADAWQPSSVARDGLPNPSPLRPDLAIRLEHWKNHRHFCGTLVMRAWCAAR